MTQPFDCAARVPSLTQLDKPRGEFWVENPWDFSSSRQNLSAYERNGVFLNAAGKAFHDIGFLTGADSPGDGRSAVACDITGDGMAELFVRQTGGGVLLVFENRFPPMNWLTVSLRGTQSNSFGIGAKIACQAGGQTIRRELFPVINFLSQAPAMVQLGLGEARQVDKLTIRWPSGIEQTLKGLAVNRHIRIHEGRDDIETIQPGEPAEAGR